MDITDKELTRDTKNIIVLFNGRKIRFENLQGFTKESIEATLEKIRKRINFDNNW